MDWETEKHRWPNAELSRFVETRAQRWHVQTGGAGPAILLLHGAGGATHSWRDILPALTPQARVLAPDLPGHGFTQPKTGGRSGLVTMAQDLHALCEEMDVRPELIVGHSAGAAIALQMTLDGATPRYILGINAALRPFEGMAGVVFPPLAKLLALNPMTARLFAWSASNPGSIRNLTEGVGSRLDPEMLTLYRACISDPAHVDGALRMMARWDLKPLLRRLPEIVTPTTFAIGGRDKAVPPHTTREEAARMPHAQVRDYPDLGHLMHEEAPEIFADLILELLAADTSVV